MIDPGPGVTKQTRKLPASGPPGAGRLREWNCAPANPAESADAMPQRVVPQGGLVLDRWLDDEVMRLGAAARDPAAERILPATCRGERPDGPSGDTVAA